MIKEKLYTIVLLVVFLLGQISCSDDKVTEPIGEGDEAIEVGALGTRFDGDIYSDLYMKAYMESDMLTEYFSETAITIAGGLSESIPQNINFAGGEKRYYPLGNNEIRLFAYTGKLDTAGVMPLTSGHTLPHDYLLSNQGYRNNVVGLSTEGEGTPGSSADPATILQFRHVMSLIELVVEVDDTEVPPVDPEPKKVQFRMDGVHTSGTYPITALAPVDGDEANATVASGLSGNFTLQLGINYVVPSGEDLLNKTLRYLNIDDYIATEDDLSVFQIDYLGPESSALLVPGYAYTLRFKINRLGIQAITLQLVDWDLVVLRNLENNSYDPYPLALDLGAYPNSGTDEIVKVVLHTTDDKLYVGGLMDDSSPDIGFVTLPPTGTVDSVSLYTDLGMLIGMTPDDYTYNATGTSLLTLTLSEGGMRLENPLLSNDKDNPYLIYTPVQIFNMSKNMTASYRLMNDVDIDRLSYSETNDLTPLGAFSGHFNGNGYRINNLIMTGPALLAINDGVIENLHLGAGRINGAGENIVGGICAVNAGTIIACVNELRIINAPDIVGGICGQNVAGGEIVACLNTGIIENGNIIGGICGQNLNTDPLCFVSCVNTGMLYRTPTNQLGGIVGDSDPTGNDIITTSFWLVGTAAQQFGGAEEAVGSNNVGTIDVASLHPEKLRKNLSGDDTDVTQTMALLNAAIDAISPPLDTVHEYKYILDQEQTGIVWVTPAIKP